MGGVRSPSHQRYLHRPPSVTPGETGRRPHPVDGRRESFHRGLRAGRDRRRTGDAGEPGSGFLLAPVRHGRLAPEVEKTGYSGGERHGPHVDSGHRHPDCRGKVDRRTRRDPAGSRCGSRRDGLGHLPGSDPASHGDLASVGDPHFNRGRVRGLRTVRILRLSTGAGSPMVRLAGGGRMAGIQPDARNGILEGLAHVPGRERGGGGQIQQ